MKALYAQDLCLLQGPPGTGKTTVIAEMLWQLIRKKQQTRVMLTSQTNLAIDNALSRLLGEFVTSSTSDMQRYRTIVKPIRIADTDKLSEEGMRFTSNRIDAWAQDGKKEDSDNVVSDWLDNIANRINPEDFTSCASVLLAWQQDLRNPGKFIRKTFAEAYKSGCNIIGMTCGKVGSTDFKNNGGEVGFDVAIMDEASKCTPPELLMPLCYAQKAIVIGDHRQLPPVTFERDFWDRLKELNNERASYLASVLEKDYLKTCLFKRLVLNPKVSPTIKASFKEQYRMHPQINAVIEQFYKEDGGLKCGLNLAKVDLPNLNEKESRYHGFELPGVIAPVKHVVWIDVTDGKEEREGGDKSAFNMQEVKVIKKLLVALSKSAGFSNYFRFWKECGNAEREMTEGQIGVISFYSAQVKKLRDKVMQSLRDSGFGVSLRTDAVDNFQGQERGIVIVSTVCTGGSGGFTREPERLNVALSRARRLLIIVGNSQFFYNVKDKEGRYIYRDVIDQIKAMGSMVDSKKLDEYNY